MVLGTTTATITLREVLLVELQHAYGRESLHIVIKSVFNLGIEVFFLSLKGCLGKSLVPPGFKHVHCTPIVSSEM